MTASKRARSGQALQADPNALVGRVVELPEAVGQIERVRLVETDRGQVWQLEGYVAPTVRFALRAPAGEWCGRLAMIGQGGYGGRVPFEMWPTVHGAGDLVAERGFAAITHDGGHQASEARDADGVWAAGRPEAIADFAYAAGHRVLLVARQVVELLYGAPASRSYFIGCSAGGRSGLQHAQRYPRDFDGIACEAPNIDMVATNTFWHSWNARVNRAEDGRPIVTADLLPGIHAAVLEAARAADPRVENVVVDPRTVRFDAHSLTKGDIGKPLLTPQQADVVNRLHDGPRDEEGRRLHPGGLPYGSELAWLGNVVPPLGQAMGWETSMDHRYSVDFPSYMASLDGPTGLTNENLRFTREEFERLDELSGVYDPTNPDLSGFAATGGKLVVWQGWADPSASPLSTLNYFDAVYRHQGPSSQDFFALFLVPGAFHCGHGPATIGADYLTPLIAWVEDSETPEKIRTTLTVPGAGPMAVRRYLPGRETDRTEWLGSFHYTPGRSHWIEAVYSVTGNDSATSRRESSNLGRA